MEKPEAFQNKPINFSESFIRVHEAYQRSSFMPHFMLVRIFPTSCR